MGYIYVEKDGVQAQYLITSTANEPRICVNTTGYVPLVMGTINAPMIKYAPADGYETLRAGSYTTTTVKSTSSSVGSSSVGCAGTSSSSGSTVNTTIQASTAISFTSTSAFTRSSTSGYNGLSGAAAQTCSSTSSWKGVSTSRSDYQTTLANSAGMWNVTGLTRESVYGYEDCVSTTGWDYPQAYQATATWYYTPTRTYGYSGYSIRDTPMAVDGCYLYCETTTEGSGMRVCNFAKYSGYITYNYGANYASFGCGGSYRLNGVWRDRYAGYDVPYPGVWGDRATGYVIWPDLGAGAYFDSGWWFNGQTITGTKHNYETIYYSAADSAGMSGVTALTENYVDYANPQYDYGWVVTNTVARTIRVTTRTLTRASTSSWKGISSRRSNYTTTLANSAGLSSTTALTRKSTSAYSGTSYRRSNYMGTQVNSVGMTSASALTCESIYGYSGVSTRRSNYNTTSINVGNMSNTTALLEPVYRTNTVTSAYSGIRYEYSTYAHSFVYGYFYYNSDGSYNYTVKNVDAASYEIYDTHGDRIARNNSYQGGWMPAYVDFRRNVGGHLVDGIMDINIPDATNTAHNIFYSYDVVSATGTGGPAGGGNTYTFSKTFNEAINTITYSSTNAVGMGSITELTGTVLGIVDHYMTTAYSGESSRASNYEKTQANIVGLSSVTTLTRSSTSGYSGQLSRTSSYETLIPNDGANALVAQALTCSSTSQWGGKSSTSESISSTENRTSYFTSGYTESTTASATSRIQTTTIYSNTMTVQSSSLSSGNGYKIVGGALVVDQGGYAYYTVESYSTREQSTFVVVAESMETTTLRTGTYTRMSQAIMSYGARTSLSTYVNTNTYIETIWGYM